MSRPRMSRTGLSALVLRAVALRAVAVGAVVSSVAPLATLGAQGTLSGLGFGYPVGGVSTRAAGTAGAFGEFDAVSPRNPASLGGLGRTLIAAQTEPEFRTLRVGALKERTRAQRIPLLLVAFPAQRGIAVALSATTFLDRSYTTVTKGTVNIGGNALTTDDRSDVRGSIADLRAAVGWRINPKVSVGLGGHLFTGDNVVAISRTFSDTTAFGSVLDSSRVTYFGTGVSLGTEVHVAKGLAASASFRSGGSIESRVRDSIRTRGNVPNRIGAALRYEGVAGAIFAIGVERQDWTRMKALGSALVQAHDVVNYHAGAEVGGPRVFGSSLLLRAGYAKNTLPFGTANQLVRESRIATGFGVPLARDLVSLDFSLQRANRTLGGGGAKESAWLLGVGVQIRPGGP